MSALQSRVAELRQRFIEHTAGLAAEIAAMADNADWDGVRFACHGLAGRAGMFGFPALGALASQIELAIEGGAGLAELSPAVATLLEEMKTQAAVSA